MAFASPSSVKEDGNRTFSIGLLCGLNELKYIICLEQPAPGQCEMCLLETCLLLGFCRTLQKDRLFTNGTKRAKSGKGIYQEGTLFRSTSWPDCQVPV